MDEFINMAQMALEEMSGAANELLHKSEAASNPVDKLAYTAEAYGYLEAHKILAVQYSKALDAELESLNG